MNATEFKDFRQKLQMTQADLAKRLKVTWRTVARWEAGSTPVPEVVRLAMREVLRQESN